MKWLPFALTPSSERRRPDGVGNCRCASRQDAKGAKGGSLGPIQGGGIGEVIGICFWGRRNDLALGRAAPPRGGHRRRASPAPQGSPWSGWSIRHPGRPASRGKMRRLWGGPDRSRAVAGADPAPMERRLPQRPELIPGRAKNHAATIRCSGHGNGCPAMGGLCTRVGQSPRCVRIFAMTSGCSMKAMIRIAPAHRGQTSGSAS